MFYHQIQRSILAFQGVCPPVLGTDQKPPHQLSVQCDFLAATERPPANVLRLWGGCWGCLADHAWGELGRELLHLRQEAMAKFGFLKHCWSQTCRRAAAQVLPAFFLSTPVCAVEVCLLTSPWACRGQLCHCCFPRVPGRETLGSLVHPMWPLTLRCTLSSTGPECTLRKCQRLCLGARWRGASWPCSRGIYLSVLRDEVLIV